MGIGKAKGEFYEETDPSCFYDIEYRQRVNVDWMIAEDKPVAFVGKGFQKTLGITGNMSFRALFPIQKEAYDFVCDLMKSNANWTEEENEIIMADYFEMLLKEIMHEEFDANEHKLALEQKLTIRSTKSIESKYHAISAILDKNNFSYLSCYMPKGSYLANFEEKVLLKNVKAIMAYKDKTPIIAVTTENFQDFLVDPPDLEEKKKKGSNQKGKVDFYKNGLENKGLGNKGEEFALAIEKAKLMKAGKEDLIDKIVYVAQEDDYAGYDIKSFSEEGKEIFIEVKTTNGNSSQPFFLSASEYRKATEFCEKYFIYRIYNINKNPKYFVLSVDKLDKLKMEAANYKISFEK